MQLSETIYAEIQDLADQGNVAIDQGRLGDAITLWQSALQLLPTPASQWQAAFWLYASMGEAYYQLELFDEAIVVLNQALTSPESKENPYPYYMLGKCHWRLEHERAAEYLLQAYELDGQGIFAADMVDGEVCLQYLYDRGLL